MITSGGRLVIRSYRHNLLFSVNLYRVVCGNIEWYHYIPIGRQTRVALNVLWGTRFYCIFYWQKRESLNETIIVGSSTSAVESHAHAPAKENVKRNLALYCLNVNIMRAPGNTTSRVYFYFCKTIKCDIRILNLYIYNMYI